MRTFSLKIKMTLVVFLLISIVVTAVTGLGLAFFIREFKATLAKQQFTTVSTMAVELDDDIASAQRELVAVARSVPPALTRDPAAMQRFLEGRLDLNDVFDGAGYFSQQGILVAASPGEDSLLGRDFSVRDFYKETVRSGRPFISEPFPTAKGSGHQVVVFTAPVVNAEGRMAGFLAGRLDLTEENLLGRLSRRKVGNDGDYFLFNNRRQLLVQKDCDSHDGRVVLPANCPLVDRAIAGFEGSAESSGRGAVRELCSFKRLHSTGWILAARVPITEAYAPIRRAQELVAWCIAIGLPLTLLAVWLFVRKLTRPLLLLTDRITGMAGAGAAASPPQGRQCGDEIGALANSFDRVMQELGRQTELLEKEKTFSEQILQQTAVPCYVMNREHRVIIWNRACEELTGVSAAEAISSPEPWRAFYDAPRKVLADIVIDGSLDEMADLYPSYSDSPLIREGLRAEGWYQIRGKQKFLTFDAAPIRDAEGRVIAAIQTLQDVTVRATTEERLRSMVAAIGESEERFRRLVELSLDGIAILVDRRLVFTNAAGCDMLGCSPDELYGKDMRDFIHPDSQQLFDEQLEYAKESGVTAPWLEERLTRGDGNSVEVELGMTRFVFGGDEALQVIFRDITERKLAKARLESLAHYDSLTSLPNRVLFFDRLERAVADSDRYRQPMALMFLDLDRFKEINDTLGHAAGDVVLVEAGRRLKECVRGCDMVARMGGDEFTIILSKLADDLDAALVAERIITSLALPFQVEGTMASIGVSIGICVYPAYGSDLDAIVRFADIALYRAKEAGRNGYCFYDGDGKGARQGVGARGEGRGAKG